MDEMDHAQAKMEIDLADSIRKARKPEGPIPNGRCHYCDEIVSDTQRWCDRACRDLWQKETGR